MNAQIKQPQEIWIPGFYHSNSLLNPITDQQIQGLIDNEVFDPQYGEKQNGLRGIYEAELEAIREGWEYPRVMHRTFIAVDTTVAPYKPVGVATVRLIHRDNPMKKNADFILHVYVKPEYRNRKIASRMVDYMRAIANVPGMAMEETETSKWLLAKYRSIAPIRRPTRLDRDLVRCLRTLDRNDVWTNRDGSLLVHSEIAETLRAQDELIKQLRKQVNPHDNSITYPS